MSFELILPFLTPIAHFLKDDDVSEIMVNGTGRVFVERRGLLEAHDDIHLTNANLETSVKNIARVLGDEISAQKPLLDGRLPDGSRVAAVLPPCSIGGITLTIRKFQNKRWTLAELVRTGALPETVRDRVAAAILDHKNILIAGGTGTGKTTMLNALASLIPTTERLVIIEDTAEIQLTAPNLVRFEARREQASDNPEDHIPAITIRDLLKASLRHRPDRIILGEIRGGEAFDLLQALNTGHSGSLSTIHANSAVQSVSRFSNCVLQSGIEIPHRAIQAQIADALDLLLYIERRHGNRYVAELAELRGYNAQTDTYNIVTVYEREFAVVKDPPIDRTAADLATLATINHYLDFTPLPTYPLTTGDRP